MEGLLVEHVLAEPGTDALEVGDVVGQLLHGFQASAELITVWTLDVRQNNASTTLVLELHQLLSMLSFFVAGLLEELVESTQSNVIPVKVIGHRLVNIAGVQLQVDLLVDARLRFDVVVLT